MCHGNCFCFKQFIFKFKLDVHSQTSIKRINAEMQLSVIGKCPLFEKTRILPSVDAQCTFWLKSLHYCYVAKTYCA